MIRYVTGDATQPPTRPALIAHVVNDVGFYGAGFSGALARAHPWTERAFRYWVASPLGPIQVKGLWVLPPYQLGSTLASSGDDHLIVAHMCAQHGVGRGRQRILYPMLSRCLAHLVDHYLIPFYPNHSIHMPRIGTGLGGGTWADVLPILDRHLARYDVTVYDLP